MKRSLLKALFLCFALTQISSLSAEEVSVLSSLDKRTASLEEDIHLSIKISGASGNVQAPQLPSSKGFDTFYTGRSSNITFINGQMSSSVEFSYVLRAREAGKHSFGPIDVFVSGRQFRTDAMQIEIVDSPSAGSGLGAQPSKPSGYTSPFPFAGGSGAPRSSSPPSSSTPQQEEAPPAFKPEDDNIFVTATLDKPSAFPNEQVLLTYSLYTRYDTRYEGFQEEPEVSGFWIEEFPQDREVPRETVRMNGKRYVKAEIRKMALFPTAAAEYTIKPGVLKTSIRQEPQSTSVFDEFFNDSFFSGGGFFARRENRLLQPPPIQLSVKSLPEMGKPESFQGAVGNFRLNATIDKQSVKQDEPVTVKLVIEGEGNVETLNKPKFPELADFKVYDGDASSQLFKTGNVIGGRKTFEIVFIPIKAGNLKIPPLDFSHFNPASYSYIRVLTPEFRLTVTPSDQTFTLPASASREEALKKEITLEAQDIRFIQEKLGSDSEGSILGVALKGLLGADFVLLLLLGFGLLRERQDKVFARDSALRRRRLAKTLAEKRIRGLAKIGKGNDDKSVTATLEEVAKITTQYLSNKFNLSTHGITKAELEVKLGQVLGTSDPLYREIMDLYLLCEESRYAKAGVPAEIKSKALKTLRETMARVERSVK